MFLSRCSGLASEAALSGLSAKGLNGSRRLISRPRKATQLSCSHKYFCSSSTTGSISPDVLLNDSVNPLQNGADTVPIRKIVNGREYIIPKPLPTKFNKSTQRLIDSVENTSIREPRLRRWKEKQKRLKLRKNPWKDYMVAGARDEPEVVFEKNENNRIPKTDWKNFAPITSPLDFTFLEKEYSPNFEEKVAKRKNLWYHRKAHKRANTIIKHLNKEGVASLTKKTKIPEFTGGDALEVRFKGNLKDERENIFRGVCLGRKNAGLSSSFKIIGVVNEVPVEYSFPLYSPLISRIRLVKKGYVKKEGKNVRRAKVYYIRDLPTSTYTVTKSDMEAADAQDRRDAIRTRKEAKKRKKEALLAAERKDKEN